MQRSSGGTGQTLEAWPLISQVESHRSRGKLRVDDGSSVEGYAVQKQPTVQRLSVLFLPVGVESSGERAAAAEETQRQGEESDAHAARQVRRATKEALYHFDTM